MTCKKTTDKKKQNKTIDIQLWFKEKYYNFHSYLQYTEEQMKLLNYKIITPFKKPSARKSFAPLLNAHPLKAISKKDKHENLHPNQVYLFPVNRWVLIVWAISGSQLERVDDWSGKLLWIDSKLRAYAT